jgi:AcrR family transcriptional regulator
VRRDDDGAALAPRGPAGGTTRRRPRHDPRRERTPQKLIAAARVVFERDGFHGARLSDVTKEANVSTGTLYNYFQSKEELFRAVMQGVLDDLTKAGGAEDAASPDAAAPADPVQGIIEANRSYIAGYRRNARLMSVLTQVAERDPEVLAIGIAIREHFETRISRAIARWQEAGLAYSDLDPVYTANALAYMVDRFLHEWHALGLPYDEERVADTLNKLWIRALGLADGPRTRPAG